ncbi:MAG: hypothetical protein HWD59_14145 [Coxiellaceae bacterium]|nr:MAG: hypothetical protein HWD59_14145 [Coxiellaceae bacterium]
MTSDPGKQFAELGRMKQDKVRRLNKLKAHFVVNDFIVLTDNINLSPNTCCGLRELPSCGHIITHQSIL